MKTFRQTVLPLLAGVMFLASLLWEILTRMSSIFTSFIAIPIYIILVIALFRRRRNHMLTVGTALMIFYRVQIVNLYAANRFPEDSQPFVPFWHLTAALYLAGTVLLLAVILVNVTPKLKKFRPYVNPFWFLPGAAMLAGALIYALQFSSALNESFLLCLVNLPFMLGGIATPLTDAIATLLIPLWLKLCAPDDLEPYERMVGQMFTAEQLEEKRAELGLAKRKSAV